MKLKLTLTALAFLAVGISIGRQLAVPLAQMNEAKVESSLDTSRLQHIADVDMQDYFRLKTQEERYKKADEILGKIMAIFLTDLSIKVSRPESDAGSTASASPQPTPTTIDSAATEPTEPRSTVKPQARLARKPILEVRSQEDIAEFIEASKIADFEEALRSSSPFSNANGQLQNINGRFSGRAQIQDENISTVWDIEMALAARASGGKIAGRRSLRLSENGKNLSDSSGNGELEDDYRQLASDPEAIVISAGPNYVLQAYYIRSTDQVVGTIMKKNKMTGGPFKAVGTFELARR